MVIPGIIFLIIFAYLPMYGILMAFQEFRLGDFPGLSKFVGFKQFDYLFNDPNFSKVLRNTLAISALKICIGFPMPIIFAIMLNELRNPQIKKSLQTISYLPHFISWVVGATLMFDFLSIDNGAVNDILVGLRLIKEPIYFFGKGELFWGLTVITDLWKELGWNSIIFIASIASIDAAMYEAADVDGASRLAKIWHITFMSILPTVTILFIFTIGNILNANFDQIMMLTSQMGNSLLREYADVIDTYVYRVGLREARYSFAAAAGLFKSIINFFLLLSANYIVTRLSPDNALF
jgi:putative aldouronate transport system permease protein